MVHLFVPGKITMETCTINRARRDFKGEVHVKLKRARRDFVTISQDCVNRAWRDFDRQTHFINRARRHFEDHVRV